MPHEPRKRGLSQMIGLLLLTMIIVASTVTIHSTITSIGLGDETIDTAGVLSNILIEGLLPLYDELNPSKCYAIDLVLRNPGTDPVGLRGLGLYIYSDEKTIPGYHIPLQGHGLIPPGNTLRMRFYPSEEVARGDVIVRLTTRTAVSDAFGVNLKCSIAPGEAIVLRKEGESVTVIVDGVSFTVWLEKTVSGSTVAYEVLYNITVDRPVPAGGIRGEILTKGLEHPVSVAYPVFHNSQDYVPGVVYQGYWAPVRDFELPVVVFWSVLD